MRQTEGRSIIRIIRPAAEMQNEDKVNADLRQGSTMSPNAAPGDGPAPLRGTLRGFEDKAARSENVSRAATM
jgi:hypothetical protein